MRIYKYELNEPFTCKLIKPLHVDWQFDKCCFWALVDSSAPIEEQKTYKCVHIGTGHLLNEEWLAGAQYIGTLQNCGGEIVWHYFLEEV